MTTEDEQLQTRGFAVLRGAIPPPLMDRFVADLTAAIRGKLPLLTHSHKGTGIPVGDLTERELRDARIMDVECHLTSALAIVLAEPITNVLREIYDAAPTCLQTLTYQYSSQQAAHSDYYLVSPPHVGEYDRDTLLATWVALEEATEDNGAVVYYEGSHRLPLRNLMTEHHGDYGDYSRALEQTCIDAGLPRTVFTAQRGDVLFWHGNLVHAGGVIKEPSRTRLSLVSHYAKHPERHAALGGGRTRVRFADAWLYV